MLATADTHARLLADLSMTRGLWSEHHWTDRDGDEHDAILGYSWERVLPGDRSVPADGGPVIEALTIDGERVDPARWDWLVAVLVEKAWAEYHADTRRRFA